MPVPPCQRDTPGQSSAGQPYPFPASGGTTAPVSAPTNPPTPPGVRPGQPKAPPPVLTAASDTPPPGAAASAPFVYAEFMHEALPSVSVLSESTDVGSWADAQVVPVGSGAHVAQPFLNSGQLADLATEAASELALGSGMRLPDSEGDGG